jgi:hypothetical protein
MPCRDDLQLLAYYDGELDPSRACEVAAHVAECAVCRHRLAMWRRAGTWLRADDEECEANRPSPDIWTAIHARIADVDATRDGRVAPIRSAGRDTRTLPADARRRVRARRAVAIAAAASLGGLLLTRAPAPPIDVIRSLDAFGASVLVMNRDDEEATIIWMIDEEGRMIDEEGRMIDEESPMIDEEGPRGDGEARRRDGDDARIVREKRPIDEARDAGDASRFGAAGAGRALAP